MELTMPKTNIIFTRSCLMVLMLFEMVFVLALVMEMVLYSNHRDGFRAV